MTTFRLIHIGTALIALLALIAVSAKLYGQLQTDSAFILLATAVALNSISISMSLHAIDKAKL